MFPPRKDRPATEPPGEAEEDWASDKYKQMVTEVWVEPQCGVVSGVGAGFPYVEGLEYQDIPTAVSRPVTSEGG